MFEFTLFLIYLYMWVHCPFLNFPKIENTNRGSEENTGSVCIFIYAIYFLSHTHYLF